MCGLSLCAHRQQVGQLQQLSAGAADAAAAAAGAVVVITVGLAARRRWLPRRAATGLRQDRVEVHSVHRGRLGQRGRGRGPLVGQYPGGAQR